MPTTVQFEYHSGVSGIQVQLYAFDAPNTTVNTYSVSERTNSKGSYHFSETLGLTGKHRIGLLTAAGKSHLNTTWYCDLDGSDLVFAAELATQGLRRDLVGLCVEEAGYWLDREAEAGGHVPASSVRAGSWVYGARDKKGGGCG